MNPIQSQGYSVQTEPEKCMLVLATSRHDKRLNFDTSGFLEDPKLTRKQRDSRQKFHGDKPKNQSGFILLEHKYINLYLVTPFGTKMQS